MSDELLILRDAVRVMLLRDLRALDAQIEAYPDDASVWKTVPGISNSAGTLALHLAGNLRHFIGGVLSESGYVRDRDAEFSRRGLSRAELSAEVRATIAELEKAFDAMDASQLGDTYPLAVRERRVRTADFLVHLAVHLTYHLGQIDYHRRILTPDPRIVENLSPGDLPEPSLTPA